MAIQIAWEGIQDKTTEHLTLQPEAEGIRVESRIEGLVNDHPVDLRYQLLLHPDWTWKEFRLWQGEKEVYHLIRDSHPETSTAFIDFCLTPFTNTLPIRKLNLFDGERVSIKVLYICYPPEPVKVVEQEYAKVDEYTFHYWHPSTGFEADIQVDEHGLVTQYSSLFKRIG